MLEERKLSLWKILDLHRLDMIRDYRYPVIAAVIMNFDVYLHLKKNLKILFGFFFS